MVAQTSMNRPAGARSVTKTSISDRSQIRTGAERSNFWWSATRIVRRALAMAIDNNVLLELGFSGNGLVAENHHVSPIHPEYAQMPAPIFDPVGAKALMEEAGMGEFEHDIISIDDTWRKNTSDAAAGMLRNAGINVKRTVIPGATATK